MSTQASAVQTDGAQDWRSGLPENVRGEKSLEKFKDVGGLAQGYIEAEKFMGNAIRVPKDDNPAEWDKVYSRLGRPEAPEKYDLKRPELSDDMTWDENMEKGFRASAHKAGLLPRQAQAVMDGYHAYQTERSKSAKAEQEAGLTALKTEWGNDYDKRVGFAKRAVDSFGDVKNKDGVSLKDWFNTTGLGNHPMMIRAFAKFGESLREDSFIDGGQPPRSDESLGRLRAKRAEVRNSKDFLSRIDNREHKDAIKEDERLTAQIMELEKQER